MPNGHEVAGEFITSLRTKSHVERERNARKLLRFVNDELKENSTAFIKSFLARFDSQDRTDSILHLAIESADPNDKKAAILAIVCLMDMDQRRRELADNRRITRFANVLLSRKMLLSPDPQVAELGAKAIALAAVSSKAYTADLVERALKMAYEWLAEADRNEARRYAAVLLLKEMARETPTFFFLKAHQFFDNIFTIIRDPKASLREEAVAALRAALLVSSQRDTTQSNKTQWYTASYTEAMECIRLGSEPTSASAVRDALLHSGLLILNELLRIANLDGEKEREKALELIQKNPLGGGSKESELEGDSDVIAWLYAASTPAFFESRTCRKLLSQNYNNIMTATTSGAARDSRSTLIRPVLLELLPRLATLKPQEETPDRMLSAGLDYILGCLQTDKDKRSAFLALGLFSAASSDYPMLLNHLRPNISLIFSLLKAALPPKETNKKKPAVVIDASVFTCVYLLVGALKEELEQPVKQLLPLLFATGLSPGLTVALRQITKSISGLRVHIQDGLLEQLSQRLMGRPMPPKLSPPTSPQLPDGPVPVQDVAATVHALRTLATFHFPRHSLQLFLSHIAAGYLCSESEQVRLASIRCCCRLLLPFVMLLERMEADADGHLPLLRMIHTILRRLLSVAVTDLDGGVRLWVWKSLCEAESWLGGHMAQAEMLQLVDMGLQDELFIVRQTVVQLLGKLGVLNPAYVMPTLRRLLIQILAELGCSGVPRVEEEAARLLASLVAAAPQFMKPYMQSVLRTLIEKLKEERRNWEAVLGVVAAIGELATVGGPELAHCLPTLIPTLIENLQDPSSLAKRETSLRTLGRLIQYTGYVVEPYKEHPTLMDTLLRFLRTEQSSSMHRETIRVLGIIGALDPYLQKVYTGSVDSGANAISLALSMPDTSAYPKDQRQEIVQWFNWERYSLEEFYPALAIANLMHVLTDSSLTEFHTDVVQAVLTIFRKLGGTRSLPFLEQVVPNFVPVIRTCRTQYREFFFTQLGTLVSIVGAHIKPYLGEILALIKDFWTPETPMRQTIIVVVEQVASALEYEFKPFVPQLMPAILRCFHHDDSPGQTVTAKLLNALEVCSLTLEEHLHLIIPQVVKLLDAGDTGVAVRAAALSLVVRLGRELSLRQFAPRILHALIRILGNRDAPAELRANALRLTTTLAVQMGQPFLLFRSLVDAALAKVPPAPADHGPYTKVCLQLAQDGSVVLVSRKTPRPRASRGLESSERPTQLLNDRLLAATWSVERLSAKEDWSQWLSNLRIQLLKQSPYAALRACGDPLANNYEPLAKDLFNAAFMSVWTELSEARQDDLTECLKQALEQANHSEITQTILNLAEFMDHSEKGPLPVDLKFLGRHAMKSRAFAKALRYKELEILAQGKASPENCEALITLNNKLQLQEEAIGVVEYAKQHDISIHLQGRWYEKLHQWEKALESYEMQQAANPTEEPFNVAHAKLRCLQALGDWSKLHQSSRDMWETADAGQRSDMAGLAAAGAWGQGDWEGMARYADVMPKTSQEGTFMRAVLAVHKGDFGSAHASIDKCRDLIDTELTSMAGESYERAYGAMITVQRLTELEEAVQYRLLPERRQGIRETWWKRLRGCRDNVEDWQKLLQVHSIVLTQKEMRSSWVKFAALCRQHDKVSMSRKILVSLVGGSVSPRTIPDALQRHPPDIVFAWAKQLWTEKETKKAYGLLEELVDRMMKPIRPAGTANGGRGILAAPGIEDSHLALIAKCYLKRGQWREAMAAEAKSTNTSAESEEAAIREALGFYEAARDCNRDWYKAWHALAAANFTALLYYKEKVRLEKEKAAVAAPAAISASSSDEASTTRGLSGDEASPQAVPSIPSPPLPLPIANLPTSPLLAAATTAPLTPERREQMHALQAVRCFFKAMNLCRGSRLQDTLRLLTLWFDYGHQTEVYDALSEGVKTVPLETWLQVVPQLIARIDTPRKFVSSLICRVLADIGKAHPQALVYPLTVASKSSNKGRSQNAIELVQQLREHSRQLVEQAKLVSDELIRVGILWHELWHEGLEEASKLYFTDRNPRGMFATLRPLHNMIEQGPTTMKEQSFHQTYYRDLKEAREWCDKFERSQNAKDMSQAWDLYYLVFKKISRQLPGLTSLELQYVSPKLLQCKDMDLAVPGTYDPNAPLIRIASVHPNLQVITSKQRPRKVCVKGDDGKDYWFLLKGHEDPRQDERVMQLFGLVNTLLLQEPDTCRRNLTIQRYSIVPLSQNSGLIGWVPNCDTLHTLLRDYREKKKTLLNIEHKLMQRMAPDYDKLTLMQKVEVFEHALEHTNGDDLQKILWLKSPSSELWFHRRTNYTRSLATMSMVGYVLGLGDRHPSNLMLDRMSGKMIHIDFGDCFEVAMTRDKYPEKIPFRLTRMLLNAMEVTGIEGNFKLTCERVMKVLRENRESVLAVLEAFVYDPLINWRLLDQGALHHHGSSRRQNPESAHLLPRGPSSIPDAPADLKTASDSVDVGRDVAELGEAAGLNVNGAATQQVSAKAVAVMERIKSKLSGRDFPEATEVPQQVSALIAQAMSHENLCQCYIGWCPFW